MSDDAPLDLCAECGAALAPGAPRCENCGAATTRRPRSPKLDRSPANEAVWTRIERATKVFLAVSVVASALQLALNPAARGLQVLGSAVVLGAGLGVLGAFRKGHTEALSVWAGFVSAAAAVALLGRVVWTVALPAPAFERVVGWSAAVNAIVYAWTLRRARGELASIRARLEPDPSGARRSP